MSGLDNDASRVVSVSVDNIMKVRLKLKNKQTFTKKTKFKMARISMPSIGVHVLNK